MSNLYSGFRSIKHKGMRVCFKEGYVSGEKLKILVTYLIDMTSCQSWAAELVFAISSVPVWAVQCLRKETTYATCYGLHDTV